MRSVCVCLLFLPSLLLRSPKGLLGMARSLHQVAEGRAGTPEKFVALGIAFTAMLRARVQPAETGQRQQTEVPMLRCTCKGHHEKGPKRDR